MLKVTCICEVYCPLFNSLPNDRILDWSKMKGFADDRIEFDKMMIFDFDRVENIVGKGESAGNQHFLLFPQCFHKASFSGLLKVGIVWYRVNLLPNDQKKSSRLKVLADNLADMVTCNEMVENILRRDKNTTYPHFLFSMLFLAPPG